MNAAVVATLHDVPGWFLRQDQALISWALERQNRLAIPGDLLELGAYLGKSAILIGRYLADGQRLVVCDLFEDAAPDHDNNNEMRQYRTTLQRREFERNYLAFHATLPTIVQGPSSAISSHIAPQSCRFAHVDASHLFEHVEGDLKACRVALRGDGLVVCDDFREAHTPGVAAAVWGAVASGDLHPICLSDRKFYGTWGDPTPVQEDLIAWLRAVAPQSFETHRIAGSTVVRIHGRLPPIAILPREGVAFARRVAVAVLPPVVTSALRAIRPTSR
jgi:hypothetical protein